VLAAMRQNKAAQAMIETHGLTFTINTILAKRYGAKAPLSHSEIVAEAQKKRWREHHKSKRIARKASVGSDAK